MQKIVAGVDIGGTHITVCLVDVEKRILIKNSLVREHVDSSMSKPKIINAWGNALRECYRKTGCTVNRIGVAMPGPFDYANGVSFIKDLHKFENLYGENIKELLAGDLDIAPDNLAFVNDASAYLLGELNCGAGVGYKNLAGITLGTGLGSASFYKNQIHEGELYKMPYKKGCAEDYISARWLISNFEINSNTKVFNVKMIADQFKDDTHCRKVFTEFGENLGEVLLNWIKPSSPEVIIIGGNISLAWDCFIPSVKNVFSKNSITTTLKKAQLGESAALIGGASLWV